MVVDANPARDATLGQRVSSHVTCASIVTPAADLRLRLALIFSSHSGSVVMLSSPFMYSRACRCVRQLYDLPGLSRRLPFLHNKSLSRYRKKCWHNRHSLRRLWQGKPKLAQTIPRIFVLSHPRISAPSNISGKRGEMAS